MKRRIIVEVDEPPVTHNVYTAMNDVLRAKFDLRCELLGIIQKASPVAALILEKVLPSSLPKKTTTGDTAKIWYEVGQLLFDLKGFVDGGDDADSSGGEEVHDIFRASITVAIEEINEERDDAARQSIGKLSEVKLKQLFLVDGAKEPEDEAMCF